MRAIDARSSQLPLRNCCARPRAGSASDTSARAARVAHRITRSYSARTGPNSSRAGACTHDEQRHRTAGRHRDGQRRRPMSQLDDDRQRDHRHAARTTRAAARRPRVSQFRHPVAAVNGRHARAQNTMPWLMTPAITTPTTPNYIPSVTAMTMCSAPQPNVARPICSRLPEHRRNHRDRMPKRHRDRQDRNHRVRVDAGEQLGADPPPDERRVGGEHDARDRAGQREVDADHDDDASRSRRRCSSPDSCARPTRLLSHGIHEICTSTAPACSCTPAPRPVRDGRARARTMPSLAATMPPAPAAEPGAEPSTNSRRCPASGGRGQPRSRSGASLARAR